MTEQKQSYEAMFLLPAGGGDFQTVVEPVRGILERNEAEVLALKPWDERRLAYEISGHRRGLYALAYFNAERDKIVEIEHDCQLAEQILRVLVLRKETLTDKDIQADTPASASTRRHAEAAKSASVAAKKSAAPEPAKSEAPQADKPEAPKEQEPATAATNKEQPATEEPQAKTADTDENKTKAEDTSEPKQPEA